MSVLLDTHALLWWLFDDERLSATARQLIADPANAVLVSSASVWEIATKYRLGRLDAARELVRDIPGWIHQAGFTEAPITSAQAQRAGLFPQDHRDPFDRMLAAQSLLLEVPLVSKDAALATFGARLIW